MLEKIPQPEEEMETPGPKPCPGDALAAEPSWFELLGALQTFIGVCNGAQKAGLQRAQQAPPSDTPQPVEHDASAGRRG